MDVFLTSFLEGLYANLVYCQVARANRHQRNWQSEEKQDGPQSQEETMTTPLPNNHYPKAAKWRNNKEIAHNNCNRCLLDLPHLKLGLLPEIIRDKGDASDDHDESEEDHEDIQENVRSLPAAEEVVSYALGMLHFVLVATETRQAIG